MQILSCHIENYGKISKRELNFNEATTVFCEENGYGKTTIASFIKAMFYGLPSYRSNTKEFNDRQHYYPFNRGKFGGNITIRCNDKVYKIERFFDKKSEKSDTLNVYDKNGSRTNELGNEPGKKIFGIDEGSFVRTAFLSSEEIELDITSGINAKLNNLVDNTNDVNNFQSAIGLLERAEKNLRADRGQGGIINRTKTEISEIEDEINNLLTVEQGLRDTYTKRNALNEQLKILEQQAESLNQVAIEQTKWQTYDAYLQDITDKETGLQEIYDLYPSDFPSAEELSRIDADMDELKRKQAELDCAVFPEEKQEKLTLLGNCFANGVPNPAQLSEITDKIGEADKGELILAREKSKAENTAIEVLTDKFRKGIPAEKTVEEVRRSVKLFVENEDRIKHLGTNFSSTERIETTKKAKILYISLAVLAAVLIIAGGVSCAFILSLGIVLIVLGFPVGCVSGFLYLKSKMTTAIPYQNAETVAEINKLRSENGDKEKKARVFLSTYGYFSDSIVADFVLLERDLNAYKKILTDDAENTKVLNALKNGHEELKNGIISFFKGFGVADGNFSDCMVILKTAITNFESLTNEQLDIATKKEVLNDIIIDLKNKINAVFAKYKLLFDFEDDNTYKQIKDNRQKVIFLSEQIAQFRQKADEYKISNGLQVRPVEPNLNIEENDGSCNRIRNEISKYNTQINDDEFRLSTLSEEQNKLEEAKEKLAEEEEKYHLLNTAETCLKQAEQNLINKYLNPMRSSFVAYAARLSNDLTDKMYMDENLNISFERDGEQRSDKHLSAGQKCVCQLCMRFALIDNMYTTEKPFIIMDDPFVSLDEKHLENVLSVLKSVTNDRQMIYFCCHNSRKIAT